MAISIEETAELAAPPEQVWAIVSDLPRWGEWLTVHKGWKSDVPAEINEGTKITGIASVLNMPNTIEWTVIEKSDSSLAVSGTGMAGAKAQISLGVEPSGAGSTLTVTSAFEGQMVVGAIAGALERAARKDLEDSIANLTELVA